MSSFIDEMREEAEQARADAEKVLAIPGSRFAVRFRPPERGKLDAFLAAYRANALTETDELQFIVDCADEVLRRAPDGQGDPQAADLEGGPLRFDGSDPRWELGENGTARQAVAKLYKLDVHPFAISGHVDTLAGWLQGLDAEMARRVEGKPAGAPS